MAKQKNNLLTWLFGIGIAVLMIFVVSIGTDLFYESPNWNDYCSGGSIGGLIIENGCDNDAYTQAYQSYLFNVYLIFSIIGMVFVIISLMSSLLFIEIAGLISGFVLMIMGMARNFDNKVMVFISSIVMLGLLIFVGYQKFKFGKKR